MNKMVLLPLSILEGLIEVIEDWECLESHELRDEFHSILCSLKGKGLRASIYANNPWAGDPDV